MKKNGIVSALIVVFIFILASATIVMAQTSDAPEGYEIIVVKAIDYVNLGTEEDVCFEFPNTYASAHIRVWHTAD